MKHEIKKFDPVSTSKISALLYAPIGLVYALIGIVMLSNDSSKDNGVAGFMLLMPLILLVGVFVMTLIWTAFYNWLASKVGGMKVEME